MNDNIETTDPNAGATILKQLQRFGSHVDRKHEVSFWLYFPSEVLAQQAAQRAERAGLRPEVSAPLKGGSPKWLCLLYCPHVPDEAILDGISQFCSQLASTFHGDFDGWEASLELDEGENPTMPLNTTSEPAPSGASEAVQG